MGAQGKQAVHPRVASSSWQPRPCRRQRTAPGGGGRDPRAVAASASPPPGSPLSPPASLTAGCGARQMAPICRGARARALLPGTLRPCQAGRAKRLLSPSRWRGRRFPGHHRSASPRANIYRQGREKIDGVHNIWDLPFAELGTGGQARLENPPSTQMNTGNPLPRSWYLYSQTVREAGVEGNKVGRAQQVQEETPPERTRGYETAETPQGLGSCPEGCVLQKWDGRGLPRVPPPGTPVFCSVTARGPAVPERGPAASLALARPGRFPCARALRIDVPATLGRSGLPRLSRSAPSRRRAGVGRLPRSARCQPRPRVTAEASCAVLSASGACRGPGTRCHVLCRRRGQGARAVPRTVRHPMNKR